MTSLSTRIALAQFTTFGELLRYLRCRAGLTQRQLAIAVGYSESQISRLEQGHRPPDAAVIAARFVPVLDLEAEPEAAEHLLTLAAQAHHPAGTGTPPAPSDSSPEP
ncbi:MAG: helix-turn-helix domain-containing protein [Anaerolineales bacterium]|nr:helix-turn-helix domain-containing protein [Anaerolineales bacterium]